MGNLLHNFLRFLLFFSFGVPFLIEGYLIVKLEKKLIPFPTKILYWLGLVLVGKKKSKEMVSQRTTPKELRSYASFALVSGTALIIFGFYYFLRFLSQLGS